MALRSLLATIHGIVRVAAFARQAGAILLPLLSPILRRVLLPALMVITAAVKRTRAQLHSNAPWTSLWNPKRLAVQTMIVTMALVGSRTTLFASDTPAPSAEQSILSRILNPAPQTELIEDSALPILQPAGSEETQNLTAADPELLELFVFDQEVGIDGGDDLAIDSDATAVESPIILPGNNAPVVPRRSGTTEYVIKEGDTVSSIAETFGISINTILWENNLTAYSTIRPGQSLKILPVSGVTYTVKAGDTLSRIAEKTNGEVDEIRTLNHLVDDKLAAGSTLVIPNGRATPAPRAVARATSGRSASINAPTPKDLNISNIVGLVWPTVSRHINQYFGRRHTGVDIKGSKGNPIYAAQDGEVALAGWNRGGYGQQVVLKHESGILTRYAHMSKIIAKPGQTVQKGQVIGLVGSTGRSTGPHLHFEVIKNGARLNPLNSYK